MSPTHRCPRLTVSLLAVSERSGLYTRAAIGVHAYITVSEKASQKAYPGSMRVGGASWMRSGRPLGGGSPLEMRLMMPVKKAGGEFRRILSRLAYSSKAYKNMFRGRRR